MRIVFATGNAGKMKEIREILSDVDAEIYSLKELGLISKAEENGSTYAENAFIKANEIFEILKESGTEKDTIIMADDSGLGIDFLNGEPGVFSARYMGYDTPYSQKNAAILEKLKDVPWEKRGAEFTCHITAILETGRVCEFEDEMKGYISYEAKGKEGFGYDPIFFIPEMGRTSGELSEEEKNLISHRGKVLRIVRDELIKEGILKRRIDAG